MSIADLRERMLKQKKIDMVNEEKVADHIATALSISDSRQVESDDWIKSVARTSYDVIWDWDINADQLAFGNNYEKVFGHKLPGNKPSFKEWVNSFMPKEKSSMEKRIRKVLISDEMSWEDTYQFVLSNGTKSQVISRANIIRDDEGKATRMIGVIHDISKLRQLEGILEEEIRIKEKQIIEAIVEAKEMERSDIGKELHDNINQLLTASILYLSMARKNIKKGDIYLTHSSEYIHTAIDEIRKLTKGLTSGPAEDFGLCLAIESMSRDAMETSPLKIHCILDYALELTMSEKFKLNTFRIFQEQLNNTLKHAKATNVHISFSQTPAGYVLSIADDGEGFDVHKKTTGIGIGNIISRAELYKGNAHFLSEPGKGCTLVVTFPVIYAV
jgi:signal transduction histidine kinase